MRSGRPSPAELRRIFERELARARDEGMLALCTGLDSETRQALITIARARPDVPDELVEQARLAFAGQLDGSHAAAQRARIKELLREYGLERREETR